MPVSFEANLAGDRELAGALRKMGAPEVRTRALQRGGRELIVQMRIHVSGPRPQRLDRVTGELLRSFATDASSLPDRISVGTPLFWAEFHELGRGTPVRPFAQPALEQTLRRLPGIFIQELERASAIAEVSPRLAPTSGQPVVVGG